jgi:DNA-binding NarL/FixJ family response regulator
MREIKIQEPLFVFLTELRTKEFVQNMQEMKISHIYSKPLLPEKLAEILELVATI